MNPWWTLWCVLLGANLGDLSVVLENYLFWKKNQPDENGRRW